MLTRQPEHRRNKRDQVFDWGGNCWVLKFTTEQTKRVMNSWKITDQETRDLFWEGYVAEPNRDYLISISPDYTNSGK